MNAFSLSIAGLRVRVAGEARLLDRLALRYRDFLETDPEEGAPAAEVRLTLDTNSKPYTYTSPPIGFAGDRIVFDLPGYRGGIDPEGDAHLAIATQPPDQGVDYFLRVVAGMCAYTAGGLMLHAAGVVRHGRACLFFGRSGRGKTTVARNSARGAVLNDDLVILMPGAGRWVAWGTPFTNPTQIPPSAGSAPAAALFHLVQSPGVFLEPISGARALAELLACVPVLNGSPNPPIDRCRAILDALPAYDLHLRADPSFWEVIDRLEL